MCEVMGSEPIAEDIPISIEDLPYEVQLAVEIHAGLPAKIAEFSGTYLGKSIGELGFLFGLYDITDLKEQKFYYRLISMLDSIEVNRAYKAKQRKASASKSKGT